MLSSRLLQRNFRRQMSREFSVKIADGVEFDTIAREWRFKWSAGNNKESLVAAQKILNKYTTNLSKLDGVKSAQRIVCGGCLDFKIIVSLPIDRFKAWESTGFAPEKSVLAELAAIEGINQIETQTYTLMPVQLH